MKLRLIILCICVAVSAAPIYGQSIDWLLPIAGGSQFANAIEDDNEGNVLVTGYFSPSMFLGGKSLTGQGAGDIFIGKINGSTGLADWARAFGGPGWNGGRSIAVGPDGSVIVAGRYQDAASFDGSQVTSLGMNDAFVAKLRPNGDVQWVRSGGGVMDDWAQGSAVDNNGNIFIVGHFQDVARFGGQQISSGGNDDIFIVKYNSNGDMLWVRSAGGNGENKAWDIITDDEGSAYVVGEFSGGARFGSINVNSTGDTDGFLAKYSANGDAVWVRTLRGGRTDVLGSIDIDAEGNILASGSFELAGEFDGLSLSAVGDVDAAVVRITPDGTALWARSFGGSGTDALSGFGQGTGVASGVNGDYWAATTFRNSINLGGESHTSVGGEDLVIVNFDADGEVLWSKACGGTGFEGFVSFALSPIGNPFFAINYDSPSFTCDDESTGNGGIFGSALGKFEVVEELARGIVSNVEEIDFGPIRIGETGVRSIIIEPANSLGLEITAAFISGVTPEDFGLSFDSHTDEDFPIVLEEGQSVEFIFSYSPTTTDPFDAFVRIGSNAEDAGVLSIPLSGSGQEVILPISNISVTSLDFGNVELGKTGELNFTISPGNSAGLTIENLGFRDSEASSEGLTILSPVPQDFPVELTEGQDLEVRIAFSPQALGAIDDGVVIFSNDAVYPETTIAVAGVGTEVVGVSEARISNDVLTAAVTPNPLGSQGAVSITLQQGAALRITIADATGTVRVHAHDGWLDAGVHAFQVVTDQLSSGWYAVNIFDGQSYYRIPFVIVR